MLFIDSSIWLDHFSNINERASTVIEGERMLACSILTLFEVKKRLIRLKVAKDKIDTALEFLKVRAVIIPPTEEIVHKAVEVSVNHNLGAIDALIYASALSEKAQLITADHDFHGLPDVEIIEHI